MKRFKDILNLPVPMKLLKFISKCEVFFFPAYENPEQGTEKK